MARVDIGASKVRARRRARIMRFALLVCAALLFICALTAWSTWAPFWRIQHVVVSGTQTLSTSTIADYVERELGGARGLIFAKDNIFLYPKGKITLDLLRDIPTLASVNVSAQNFSTLGIDIVERQPKALWCGAQAPLASSSDAASCYILDSGGAAYTQTDITGSSYERYYGALEGSSLPKQYLTPTQFQALSALIDALASQETSDPIVSVAVDSQSDVHVGFQSGFELLFSLKDAGGDVFERFTLALTADPFKGKSLSDFEYLDLRFGDKLYYKAR